MKRPTNDFWKQIALLDQNLGTVTYYGVLGLEAGADSDAIRNSYERQIRVVHPDRHGRENDASRRQCLTRVYARIGEAFRVLSHPKLRAEYDDGLGVGKLRHRQSRADTHGGAIADPQHPQAKSLFEQALTLMARKEYRGARSKLQLAQQYQPDSAAIGDALEACQERRVPTPTPPPEPLAPDEAPLATPVPAPLAEAETKEEATPEPIKPGPTSRVHTRVPMGKSLEVTCDAWKGVTSLYMQNISRGGMLLRCDEPADLGSVMELGLTAPNGESFQLPAEVVRHIPPQSEGKRPGMGIRFLLIPEPVRDSFEALLLSAGIRSESPPEPTITGTPSAEEEELARTIAKARELIDSGAARDAIPMLQIAVRSNPDNVSLRATFHLAAGLTSRAMGLQAPARHHFERALRLDSDSTLVLRHLRNDDT